MHTNRDDRTIRVLRHLAGDQNADLTFTHFMGATVRLSATSETLAGANGFLAFASAANMLTRFIGKLALVVIGKVESNLVASLKRLVVDLQQIDSRPGKSITLQYSVPTSEPGAWLHLGDALHEVVSPNGEVIFVGFDSWTCTVRRGGRAIPGIHSAIPFGALAGTCFGVAEVFKSVLATAVLKEGGRSSLHGRSVKEFRYSVWFAERCDKPRLVTGESPDVLPSIDLTGLLQVGAGAVGNASLLALCSTTALVGVVHTLDPKVVDERNLNRCHFFREADLERPKVDILASRASRPGFLVNGRQDVFSSAAVEKMWVILSTVDNNDVRHAMQEQLPRYIVQGSTSATSVAVSVQTAIDGLSCLVCRHPDRQLGLVRQLPLSIKDMAGTIGIAEEVIQRSEFSGSKEITPQFIAEVRRSNPDAAEYFVQEARGGRDLCGAIGDFRTRYGTTSGPQEASIPFASAFAGIQAAAEVVKLALSRGGLRGVPILKNVLEIDFGFDYSRHERLSFPEPRRGDCQLCVQREPQVKSLYNRKWG